jgi:hypothetical protein
VIAVVALIRRQSVSADWSADKLLGKGADLSLASARWSPVAAAVWPHALKSAFS